MILNISIVVGTFIFMEGVAWFTHKYVMHGFLWTWHKSHHKKHDHFLELNDLFAVVFSIPSIALELHLLITQSLDKRNIKYEIILVDDGSTTVEDE